MQLQEFYGNMQSESSINPGRWQSDVVAPSDPTYAGYGLVQWTPYTKYTNWVVGDPSTIDNNISRIIYEVENNVQWIATTEYNYSFREFTQSTDRAFNLGMAFLANYERPLEPDQPIRGTQAEYWYQFLGGITPPPTPDKKIKNSKKWEYLKNKKFIFYY